ncbi:hypothetical protein BSR28_01075 [Boudabousia liubingyangii]|uniref:hypothetical protein n=1 Tax=Boudabousia liubingyangii TaxID=1921764 RepID=UPI00093EFE2A|nr:hypothetical protein [Boudabousia liubingyangii]OKL48328.1 hypothetical protein BSR28_01075 [Boudabousia liubingyangii]
MSELNGYGQDQEETPPHPAIVAAREAEKYGYGPARWASALVVLAAMLILITVKAFFNTGLTGSTPLSAKGTTIFLLIVIGITLSSGYGSLGKFLQAVASLSVGIVLVVLAAFYVPEYQFQMPNWLLAADAAVLAVLGWKTSTLEPLPHRRVRAEVWYRRLYSHLRWTYYLPRTTAKEWLTKTYQDGKEDPQKELGSPTLYAAQMISEKPSWWERRQRINYWVSRPFLLLLTLLFMYLPFGIRHQGEEVHLGIWLLAGLSLLIFLGVLYGMVKRFRER